MIYLTDLGVNFNNLNEYNRAFIDSLNLRGVINIDKNVNLEPVDLSDRTSKFRISKFADPQLGVLMNAIESDPLPIFLNLSNLSHEVSALTSAMCFKQNGRNRVKVILNLDNHKDFDSADCSSDNTDNYLMFSTWGNCVRCRGYKDFISSQDEYKYLIVGSESNHSNAFFDTICDKLSSIDTPFDLYLTIDTDVYKESYTFYGDGFLEYQCVYGSIRNLLETYRGRINLCGVDITGFIDIERGRFNVGPAEKRMLSTEQKKCPNRAEQSHEKIRGLIELIQM